MENYPRVVLKPGKETPLLRQHPWIFSGAVGKYPENIKEGAVVEVFSSSGRYLATGHYQQDSIVVKALTFIQESIDLQFWIKRISSAYERRKRIGLFNLPGTNSCRLVYSEGDQLPGLIIDWFNGVAVIQAHSAGMHASKGELTEALVQVFGEQLKAVYDKSSETMHPALDKGGVPPPDAAVQDGFLYGHVETTEILETGHRFMVDVINGQKTGFYLDQRANRMFAQFYAQGRKVLNAFCYSGAFSVYALKGGATLVHSVDSSQQAIQWTKENIALNGIADELHREFVADVKRFLPSSEERYDMIILDPPAFAKRHNVTHNALQAYIHINSEALKMLNPGGILITFSCSQAINREMFRSAVQAAAIEINRDVKVLHHLSQGPDHPVSICHPEGEYLKGMILLAC